jgi:hypothetical protein
MKLKTSEEYISYLEQTLEMAITNLLRSMDTALSQRETIRVTAGALKGYAEGMISVAEGIESINKFMQSMKSSSAVSKRALKELERQVIEIAETNQRDLDSVRELAAMMNELKAQELTKLIVNEAVMNELNKFAAKTQVHYQRKTKKVLKSLTFEQKKTFFTLLKNAPRFKSDPKKINYTAFAVMLRKHLPDRINGRKLDDKHVEKMCSEAEEVERAKVKF